MRDYVTLGFALFPVIALVAGLAAVAAGLWLLAAFLIPAAITSSFGCSRLFVDICAHGVHNDR